MNSQKSWTRVLVSAFSSFVATGIAVAQDSTATPMTTTTTTTHHMWYGNWWVWALGIGVFLIVVIALTTRGRSSSA